MSRSMMSAILASAAAGFMSSAFARTASTFNFAHRLMSNDPPPARGKGNRAAKRASVKRKNQILARRSRARKH